MSEEYNNIRRDVYSSDGFIASERDQGGEWVFWRDCENIISKLAATQKEYDLLSDAYDEHARHVSALCYELRRVERELKQAREALVEIEAAFEYAPLSDTWWYTKTETMLEYIQNALASNEAKTCTNLSHDCTEVALEDDMSTEMPAGLNADG
jgi:hypothetical protein